MDLDKRLVGVQRRGAGGTAENKRTIGDLEVRIDALGNILADLLKGPKRQTRSVLSTPSTRSDPVLHSSKRILVTYVSADSGLVVPDNVTHFAEMSR